MAGDIKLVGKNAKIALKMLRDIAEFLEKHSIKYILDYGTLLGIVREQILLPWDSDMDISITSDFSDTFLKNRWKLWLMGYRTRVRRYKKDVGPFKKGSIRIIKIQTRKLFFFRGIRLMDIFVKTKVDDEYLYTVSENPYFLKSVPKEYHENFTNIHFNNKNYSVPKKFNEYLTYVYGDWQTPVKKWDFRTSDNCVKELID